MADKKEKEKEKEVIEVEPVATPANNAPVDINVASDTDRGIVKYHFELGAGKDNFEWIAQND